MISGHLSIIRTTLLVWPPRFHSLSLGREHSPIVAPIARLPWIRMCRGAIRRAHLSLECVCV